LGLALGFAWGRFCSSARALDWPSRQSSLPCSRCRRRTSYGNGAAIAVGGAPSSARKVLRFAQASDDLPGNSHPWSEAGCRRPCRQGRLRPSLRRELFDFAPQVALAYSKSLLRWKGSRG